MLWAASPWALGTYASIKYRDSDSLLLPCEGWFGLTCAIFIPPAAFLGLGTGTYLAGRWSGGRGKYWATLGGEAIGTIGAALILAILQKEMTWWGVGLIALMPGAGAIVGYELSSDASHEPAGTAMSTAYPLGWPATQSAPQLGWALEF